MLSGGDPRLGIGHGRIPIPRQLVRGHCFRHTCATQLLDSAWNLEDVRFFLEPRSIASTLISGEISLRRLRQRFAELEHSDAIADPFWLAAIMGGRGPAGTQTASAANPLGPQSIETWGRDGTPRSQG